MAGNIHFDMTSNPQDVLRAFGKAEREVDKLKAKLRDTGRVAQKTKGHMKDMGDKGKSVFGEAKMAAKHLAGPAGIGAIIAVIATVNAGYKTWLENIKMVSSETKQAATDVVAFAALQPVGTKAERTKIATELAASFGIADRGVALGTVQALQSAPGGTFLSGLKGAETVFAGTQVGISLEAGTEAERFGAGLGLAPGQMIRNLFVAGQASVLTPADLARAAPGLKFFNDPVLGPAFASVLASAVRPEQLNVFTKRGGIALSKEREDLFINAVSALKAGGIVSPGFKVPGTQEERLVFLSAFKIDTTEKLRTFGIPDVRAAEALAGVVPNLPTLRKTQEKIRRDAVPGILAEERDKLEVALPFLKQERLAQIERVRRKNALAFGVLAAPAQRETRLQVTRGRVLSELGQQQGLLGLNFADAEGRVTAFGALRFRIAEALKNAVTGAGLTPPGAELGIPGGPSRINVLEAMSQDSKILQEEMRAVNEELRIQTEVMRESQVIAHDRAAFAGFAGSIAPGAGAFVEASIFVDPIDGDTE